MECCFFIIFVVPFLKVGTNNNIYIIIISEERRNILKAHIKKIAAQQSRYLSDNYNFDYILECVDETKLNRNAVVDADAEVACLVVGVFSYSYATYFIFV